MNMEIAVTEHVPITPSDLRQYISDYFCHWLGNPKDERLPVALAAFDELVCKADDVSQNIAKLQGIIDTQRLVIEGYEAMDTRREKRSAFRAMQGGVREEREEFEIYALSKPGFDAELLKHFDSRTNEYWPTTVQSMWEGWQARAVLDALTSSGASHGFERWWHDNGAAMIQDTDPRRHCEAAWLACLGTPPSDAAAPQVDAQQASEPIALTRENIMHLASEYLYTNETDGCTGNVTYFAERLCELLYATPQPAAALIDAPIYQTCNPNGLWEDVSREFYEAVQCHRFEAVVRIVYSDCAFASQPAKD